MNIVLDKGSNYKLAKCNPEDESLKKSQEEENQKKRERLSSFAVVYSREN